MVAKAAPVKTAFQETTIRAISIGMVVSYLIHYVSRVLKEDNTFYRHRNKQLINQLIESNGTVLNEAEKLRKMEHVNIVWEDQELGKLDTESITDEIQTQVDLVSNFVELFIKLPFRKLFDLNLILERILKGERTYTQEEMKHNIRWAMKDMCGIEPTEEYISRFL